MCPECGGEHGLETRATNQRVGNPYHNAAEARAVRTVLFLHGLPSHGLKTRSTKRRVGNPIHIAASPQNCAKWTRALALGVLKCGDAKKAAGEMMPAPAQPKPIPKDIISNAACSHQLRDAINESRHHLVPISA